MSASLTAIEPVVRVTVATLFNSLWEAALLALIVWAILRFLPNVSATTRYAAWSIALTASLVLPLFTAIPQISVQHVAKHRASPAATGQTAAAVSAPVRVPSNAPGAAKPAMRAPERLRLALPEYVTLALFAAWALTAVLLLIRLGVNLFRLERLKADAMPLPVDYRERLAQWGAADKGGREVRLCTCERIEVPVAVGLFDSMILLPQHLLDSLSQDEIDQIVLHELAHLRRADDWTNGVQRVIQALFFFNPAVLFIAQQLDLEREVACDDWVVRQTEKVRPYASCLTRMAEVTAWPHRAMAAPGVFMTRRGLSVRVERLLRAGRDIRTSISFGPAGAVVAALVVLFFVLQSVAPTFAFTLQEEVVIPATTVHVPPRVVHIRPIAAKIPVTHVRVPAQTIRVPAIDLNVPAQPARIAERTVRVPGMDVTIPAQHIRIPTSPSAHRSAAGLLSNSIGKSISATVQAALGAAQAGSYMRFAPPRPPQPPGSGAHGYTCTGCDYSNQDLAGKNFRNQRFNGTDFSHSDLHDADFSDAELTGVDFSGANLRGASFRGAAMSGCDLTHADVTGATFDGATVTGCDVDARSLEPAQAAQWLRTCRNACDFSGANLHDQDLRGISLQGVDLTGADLRGANLSNANLVGIDFSGARFAGAIVSGARFTGCDFSDVDLSGLDMSGATFVGDTFGRDRKMR